MTTKNSVRIVLKAVLILMLFLTGNSHSADAGAVVNYTKAKVFCNKAMRVSFLAAGTNISQGEGWQVVTVGPEVYQMRLPQWRDSFFEIDNEKKTVYSVKGAAFGKASGAKAGTPINVTFDAKTHGSFEFTIMDAILALDTRAKVFDVKVGGQSVTSPLNWDVAEAAPGIFHLKHSGWYGDFWEIDASSGTLSHPGSAVSFGKSGQPGRAIEGVYSINKAQPSAQQAQARSYEPAPDFGFNSGAPARVTEWTASEKKLYNSVLLKGGAYDILIAPFQVQGYAFDRANRSLMTRYLANAVKSRTGLRLPDPGMVDRALGQGVRRISNNSIEMLGNELKAKVLIKGFAGHKLDEKMFVTLFVETRDENGRFGNTLNTTRLDWEGVPFSDGTPPAEAFKKMIEDILPKLPLKTTAAKAPARFQMASLPVPQAIAPLFEEQASALQNACNLQLMGMLYPDDHINEDPYEREPLFERSLIALEGVSPDSPDYRLLKSRAWFYLRSRPAAIQALGRPSSPAEKAFMAYLNGNLPEMEKWVEKVESPMNRLFAQIELNDLRLDYSDDLYDGEYVKGVAEANKGLGMLIARRMVGKEPWNSMPNLLIKKLMDEAFPVKGFEIETLVKGKFAKGEMPMDGEEIDLSIYRHMRRTQETNSESYAKLDGMDKPVATDHLDLLYTLGEANLWKKARIRITMQGLYESAKELLDSYGAIYNGHLKYTHFRRMAFAGLRDGQQPNSLYRKEANDLVSIACYHAQGQLMISSCGEYKPFENDYPRHVHSRTATDRNEIKRYSITGLNTDKYKSDPRLMSLELNLAYFHNRPKELTTYYNELVRRGMTKEAGELLKQTGGRFSGSPAKVSFLAGLAAEKGDLAGMEKIYLNAIGDSPMIWDYYSSLGDHYIEHGRAVEAKKLFESMPHIKEPDGSVSYSNLNFDIGKSFLNVGLHEYARPFLKNAGDSETGAGAEMLSRGYLALLDGKPLEAAGHFLDTYNRYDNLNAASIYIAILGAAGYHEEARAMLSSSKVFPNAAIAALVNFRVEGVPDDEQLKRLDEVGAFAGSPLAADEYAFMVMIDRPPKKVAAKPTPPPSGRRTPASTQASSTARLKSLSYFDIRTGYKQVAFSHLEDFIDQSIRPGLSKKTTGTDVIPYYAYAAARTGNSHKAEEFLMEYRKKMGTDYVYHLSMAFINGIKDRHAESIKSMELARHGITAIVIEPMQWYGLVEACEWLYKDTGRTEYRDLAVSYAKTYQRIMPLMAWAYAVEAKYSNPGPARLRALGLALYLDKASERVADIPEAEKKDALDWVERHNPLITTKVKQSGGV